MVGHDFPSPLVSVADGRVYEEYAPLRAILNDGLRRKLL